MQECGVGGPPRRGPWGRRTRGAGDRQAATTFVNANDQLALQAKQADVQTKLADAKLSDAATKLAQITTLESQGKLGGADAATLSADTANALACVNALIAGT